jgi:Ca2+-transporting ATPase
VQVPIAIALGFDKPVPGLMDRTPRPLSQPVRSVEQWVRAVGRGVHMAVATLWVRDVFEGWTNALVATTMSLTVLSLLNVALGLSSRSETHTVFTREMVTDRRQLTLYGMCLLFIVLATELGFLQRVLGTTELTGGQWLVCLAFAAALVVIEEIDKFVARRRERTEREALT